MEPVGECCGRLTIYNSIVTTDDSNSPMQTPDAAPFLNFLGKFEGAGGKSRLELAQPFYL